VASRGFLATAWNGFLVIISSSVFFLQRPGRTARRTATNGGSKRVFQAKEVPCGVFKIATLT